MKVQLTLPELKDFTAPLTISEAFVLNFVAQGMTQKYIHERMEQIGQVNLTTLNTKMQSIFSKLPEYSFPVVPATVAVLTYREGFIGPQGRFYRELTPVDRETLDVWIVQLRQGPHGAHTPTAAALSITVTQLTQRFKHIYEALADFSEVVPISEQVGMVYMIEKVRYG